MTNLSRNILRTAKGPITTAAAAHAAIFAASACRRCRLESDCVRVLGYRPTVVCSYHKPLTAVETMSGAPS